jgi:hypothetical protein
MDNWGASHDGFTYGGNVPCRVTPDARDADWCARELGDVEPRLVYHGVPTTYDAIMADAVSRFDANDPRDWFGETVEVSGPRRFTDGTLCVPVESLGRDA